MIVSHAVAPPTRILLSVVSKYIAPLTYAGAPALVACCGVINPLAVIVVNLPVEGVVAPTDPLMFIDAVPVRLVTVPLDGVPNAPPGEYFPLKAVQSADVK